MTDTKVRPAPLPPIRTLAQVRAQATALDGSRSRVATALADDQLEQQSDDLVTDPNATTGELWLYGVVGGWWRGFDAESVANALRGLDVDILYVRIHSPGGWADDGIAIGNLLRNHRARIIGVVDGYACSAASVIAVACDELIMCPGSRLMIHDATVYPGGGTAADLRLAADYADGLSQNYAGVYKHRAGGTDDQWRSLMVANGDWGTWYTADEAVAAGLADRVGTVVAVGSPPVAPEDEIDDDEDAWARAAHDLLILEQCVHPTARAAWHGDTRPPDRKSADRPTQPEGAAVVDFNDTQIASLREQVGFPADADADTIVKAVAEALNERAEASTTTQIPPGMTLVSKTQWDDTTAKAKQGADAAEALLTMQCDAALDKYKDRFPATTEAREKWAADYRRDPAGTVAYLESTKPLLPTAEQGHSGDGENSTVPTSEDPNYKKWSF